MVERFSEKKNKEDDVTMSDNLKSITISKEQNCSHNIKYKECKICYYSEEEMDEAEQEDNNSMRMKTNL